MAYQQTFPRLVRNNVIAEIREWGKIPHYFTATPGDLEDRLVEKIKTDAVRLQQKPEIYIAADIAQMILDLAAARQIGSYHLRGALPKESRRPTNPKCRERILAEFNGSLKSFAASGLTSEQILGLYKGFYAVMELYSFSRKNVERERLLQERSHGSYSKGIVLEYID